MSQEYKEEKNRQRGNKAIKTIVIIVIILTVIAFGVYQLFFKELIAESFIPENPTSVMLIDINPDSQQNRALEQLSLNLGNENIFSNYLEELFFNGISLENLKIDERDLKSWLGDRLIISRIKLSSSEDRSAQVVEIKNTEKAREILNTIGTNIQKRGSVLSVEEFREREIVFIEGKNNVAYSLSDNFLLVSEDPAGIKMMIDTSLGRNRSLSSDKVYKKLKKKLKADDYVVFAFIDVLNTLKYISGFSKQINFSFLDNIAASERINVGAVFTAQDDGIETSILMGGSGQSYEKKKGFTPNLAEKIPSDISFYIEGQDIQSFTERLLVGKGEDLSDDDIEAKSELLKKGLNLQFGIDLEEDLFNHLSGRYAFVLFPVKEGKGFSAGIVLEKNKESDLPEKMKKVEQVILEEINKNLVKDEDNDVSFIDRNYKSTTYRYAKLPEEIKADIFYAILDNELIITSSKGALTKLIDASDQSNNSLASNSKFKNNYQMIESNDATRLIYFDMRKAFEFLDNYEFLKYTAVKDEFRKIESVGFLNKYSGEGGWAQGFISIKTNE